MVLLISIFVIFHLLIICYGNLEQLLHQCWGVAHIKLIYISGDHGDPLLVGFLKFLSTFYSLSAIMQDALTNKYHLMMSFLDLKNAFGSVPVPHALGIFNMLEAVEVHSYIVHYIQFLNSTLSVIITSKLWETDPIPFQRGVSKRHLNTITMRMV